MQPDPSQRASGAAARASQDRWNSATAQTDCIKTSASRRGAERVQCVDRLAAGDRSDGRERLSRGDPRSHTGDWRPLLGVAAERKGCNIPDNTWRRGSRCAADAAGGLLSSSIEDAARVADERERRHPVEHGPAFNPVGQLAGGRGSRVSSLGSRAHPHSVLNDPASGPSCGGTHARAWPASPRRSGPSQSLGQGLGALREPGKRRTPRSSRTTTRIRSGADGAGGARGAPGALPGSMRAYEGGSVSGDWGAGLFGAYLPGSRSRRGRCRGTRADGARGHRRLVSAVEQ